MGSAYKNEAAPHVEIHATAEFVFTEITIEPLAGGMVRLLFFCEQRPVGGNAAPENVLRARAVTSSDLWDKLKRQMDFDFEGPRPF